MACAGCLEGRAETAGPLPGPGSLPETAWMPSASSHVIYPFESYFPLCAPSLCAAVIEFPSVYVSIYLGKNLCENRHAHIRVRKTQHLSPAPAHVSAGSARRRFQQHLAWRVVLFLLTESEARSQCADLLGGSKRRGWTSPDVPGASVRLLSSYKEHVHLEGTRTPGGGGMGHWCGPL